MTDNLILDPDASDHELLALVVAFYHAKLKESPDALAFLQRHGVTHSQVVEHFVLGYADRSLGLLLPPATVKAGQSIRTRLQQLGLFRESGHEHFCGSVVFPTIDPVTHHVVDLYGRKLLAGKLRKGTPLDTFLGDQRRGVWNVEALAASDEVIVCTTVLDALTFWSHGCRNVTCTFGSDVLTDDHLAALQASHVQRVLVLEESLAPRLLAAGLNCSLVRLPQGRNVHKHLEQKGDPSEVLAALLRHAEWVGNGTTQAPTTPPLNRAPKPSSAPQSVAPTTADLVAPAPAPEPTQPDPEHTRQVETTTDVEPTTTVEPSVRQVALSPTLAHDLEAVVDGDEVKLTLGGRHYRSRGWQKNLAFDQLKVNLLVNNAHGLFVDTFDLYSAKHRKAFAVQAATELHVEEKVVAKDLGRILLKLEELQDQHLNATHTPKAATPGMTNEERDAALHLLQDPHLLDAIVQDFGIVGEPSALLTGYLAAVSRKLDEPLAVIVQSSSAAGKSTLMDTILAFVPPEDLVKFSAVTGQALFYLGDGDLRHKVLAVAEEAGAERASYALKLLQSEGELTIASTGKDAGTGRLTTQTYTVTGPVALFLTTTNVQIDDELLNRCLVLTVDEGRESTKAIHKAQRRRQTLHGLLAHQERQRQLTLHRNAQRLLKPLLVANPYAEQLTFLDDKTRTRRDHAKYLTLIRAVALLHQYQRSVQIIEHQGQPVEYIEVSADDIAVANRLAHDVLGRCLDELPPQTRRLLDAIDDLVSQGCQQQGVLRVDYRFSQRQVREFSGFGDTQVKVHLKRLVDLEYLLVHKGKHGRSICYELLFEKPTQPGQRFLARLVDAERLRLSAAQGRSSIGLETASNRPCDPDAT